MLVARSMDYVTSQEQWQHSHIVALLNLCQVVLQGLLLVGHLTVLTLSIS